MDKKPFGTINGQQIFAYSISEKNLTATIIDYGATLQSLVFDGAPVILGYGSAQEYARNDGYMGATVGRYANRIRGAKFTLDGCKYTLNANDGTNALHGGEKGFHTAVWKVVEHTNNSIELEYFSKDGEEGFPGNLTTRVKYKVSDNALIINLWAKTDKPTPVNLTNHTFFNLNGKGEITDHDMTVYAEKFVELSEDHAPSGKLLSVENTPLDFRKEKRIGKDILSTHEQMQIAGGFDQFFVIDGQGLRKAVSVRSKESGIKMDCYTDCDGVLFYSGNYLTEREGVNGKISFRNGFCLEAHGYPNAVNVSHFPSPVIRENQEYNKTIEYRFSKI